MKSWNGYVMIENPAYSKLWLEPAIEKIKAEAPHGRRWRYAELNFCRVGGPHFKRMRFLTNAPRWTTAHMELLCDHKFKHPPCAGRDQVTSAPTNKFSGDAETGLDTLVSPPRTPLDTSCVSAGGAVSPLRRAA